MAMESRDSDCHSSPLALCGVLAFQVAQWALFVAAHSIATSEKGKGKGVSGVDGGQLSSGLQVPVHTEGNHESYKDQAMTGTVRYSHSASQYE